VTMRYILTKDNRVFLFTGIEQGDLMGQGAFFIQEAYTPPLT